MPMVPTGEQNYPVVTTTDNAVILAKDAAEGDTADAGITAHTIEPKRLQRSYLYRREDQAVLAGMEEALRADLSMAVSDLLDVQVLAGDGTTGAQFGGFLATAANGGILDRGDSPARVTFSLAAGEAARGIDGKFAGGLGECAVVIGDDTARDLAGKFQTNDSESALANMRAAGIACAAGHWNTGASTETPASRLCGNNWRSSWSNRARTPAARCCAPLSSASTLAATTAPRSPSSARSGRRLSAPQGPAAAAVRRRPGAAIRDRRQLGELRARRLDAGLRERRQGVMFQPDAPVNRGRRA